MVIPSSARELIAQLDSVYPEKCPGLHDSERETYMYAGKRQLVKDLLASLEVQDRKEKKQQQGKMYA